MSELSRDKQLESILHGYLQAVDAGQNPDRDDLLRRHPELADDLREFFADQAKMDRVLEQAMSLISRGLEPSDSPTKPHRAKRK